MTEEQVEQILEMIQGGYGVRTACREIEVEYEVFTEALADTDLSYRLSAAQMEAAEAVRAALFEAATAGNVQAMALWLQTNPG